MPVLAGKNLGEALAGHPPYAGDTWAAVLQAMEQPIPPPAGPAPLVSVALKALAREPAGRYPDADAFAAELENWLAGLPVAAHRYSKAAYLAQRGLRVIMWLARPWRGRAPASPEVP